MLKTKSLNRVTMSVTVLMLVAALLLWGRVEAVQSNGSHTMGYEDLLFDQSYVHTIDITMDNWDELIDTATTETYMECSITIDGEKYGSVAIRAKGNTSLSTVATLGSTRYSFKVEFDHYVKGMTYHSLDKLSLNNLIQDATMMKDYLAYTLMNRMGVPTPLCKFVQLSVNGEPWGLYLAVEGVEEGFLERNGMSKGELYKPDSLSFGGGRGNSKEFDFSQFSRTMMRRMIPTLRTMHQPCRTAAASPAHPIHQRMNSRHPPAPPRISPPAAISHRPAATARRIRQVCRISRSVTRPVIRLTRIRTAQPRAARFPCQAAVSASAWAAMT